MDVNLLLLKKDGAFKAIPMPSDVTIIGRRRDCDLRVEVDAVSRRHCRLFKDNNILKVRDLDSRNGTVINGQAVEETDVKPGDKLTIGSVTFVIQVDGKPDKFDVMDEDEKRTDSADTDISEDELFADVGDIDDEDTQL
jgi:pSer/pThr/pTyr-binding forkhead associated (FHA) protein